MKSDVRERMVQRLMQYSEKVTGYPATYENRLYWILLPDNQLKKVYAKWKGWANKL